MIAITTLRTMIVFWPHCTLCHLNYEDYTCKDEVLDFKESIRVSEAHEDGKEGSSSECPVIGLSAEEMFQ